MAESAARLAFLATLAACASALVLPARPVAAVCRRSAIAAMHAGMGGPATATDMTSFVQTEMRGAAMKLHTRDQSKEGEQKAQKPVNQWEPQKADYLQFLVDSRTVYSTFEGLVAATDVLAPFRATGLERTAALDADIAWFESEGLPTPAVGAAGLEYAATIRALADAKAWPRLVCHFYNFYFAHTAGGQMIGKMMGAKLLGGRTLEFYQWGGADPKEALLPGLRGKIDEMALTWSREEKDACLAETAASFRGGGSLMGSIRGGGGSGLGPSALPKGL